MVRCLKLLKPYGKKKEEEEDDDNEDDDNDGKNLMAEGRDVERDVASHAYEIGQFAQAIIYLFLKCVCSCQFNRFGRKYHFGTTKY